MSAPASGSTSLALNDILSNISQSLDGTGFVFGAGSSFEAGYPLMVTLTKQVIDKLNFQEKDMLDRVLEAAGLPYDQTTGLPNIEQIADLVIAHFTNTNVPAFSVLEKKLRQLTLDSILSVSNPDLSHHITFFERLKSRAYGQPCTVWIFTTNYDLLFETAASITGVQLDNGFVGTTERYFSPDVFQRISGTLSWGRFNKDNHLTVKLIKLHGSISWFKFGDKIYERHPLAIPQEQERVMVMPRRRKVMDTLVSPYDSLFALSTKVLGGQCKYLVSCGFSFSDDHINEHIFSGVMKNAKCRLSVLCDAEPTAIKDFFGMRNYTAGHNSHLVINGMPTIGSTDLWKFSNFVQLF